VQDGFVGIKILDLEDNVKSMKMSYANRSSSGNGSGPGYNNDNGDATSLYTCIQIGNQILKKQLIPKGELINSILY
jgi:hypothetical protein